MKKKWLIGTLLALLVLCSLCSAHAVELNVPTTVSEIPDIPAYPGEIECNISVQDGHLLFVFDERVTSSWQLYVQNYDDGSWQHYTYEETYGGFISETDGYTTDDTAFNGYYDLSCVRTKVGAGLDETHMVNRYDTIIGTIIRMKNYDGYYWEWTDGSITGYGCGDILNCSYTPDTGYLSIYNYRKQISEDYFPNIKVTYNPQGILLNAMFRLDSSSTFFYSPSKDAWSCNGVASEAPEGYDLDQLQASFPPLVYAEFLTLPDKPSGTLSEIGIDTNELLSNIPTRCDAFVENGILCVNAQPYETIYFNSYSASTELTNFAWNNNRWESTSGTVTDSVLTDYSLTITGNGRNKKYRDGLLVSCRWMVNHGDNIQYSPDSWHLSLNGNDILADYTSEGNLIGYYCNIDDVGIIYYNAYGQIEVVQYDENTSWAPSGGWQCYNWDTGEWDSCEAPEGLEAYTTEADWKAAFPPLVIIAPSTYDVALPAALQSVEASAFAGTPIRRVYIPDGTTIIGSQAFSGCTALDFIRIPATVISIAADAFDGCSGLTIVAPADSYAAAYANENGIPCITE